MATPYLLLLLAVCSALRNISASSIKQFSITTDVENPGNGLVNLIATLNWNDMQYQCIFTPDTINMAYICKSPGWTTASITADEIPYRMKIEWDSSAPFQFTSINVTSDTHGYDIWYKIDHFCIADGMQCTINDLIGDEDTEQSCEQWDSKNRYNVVGLDNEITKFKLLYIDYRNSIEAFEYSNSVVEGSVRPPVLVNIGFTTGSVGSGQSGAPFVINNIQWDQTLYQCNVLAGNNGNTNYDCSVSTTGLGCQADQKQNDFWFSIYLANTAAFQCNFDDIHVTDETGNTYYVDSFCVDPSYGAGGSACTISTPSDGLIKTSIAISPFGAWKKMFAGYFDSCIFKYPNNITGPAASISFDVSSNVSVTPDLWGWRDPRNCSDTVAPSNAPSTSPTQPPSIVPTIAPSQPPSTVPSSIPTQPPSLIPSQSPSSIPTQPPSLSPSQPPSLIPTLTPTNQPSLKPSSIPTQPPSLIPSQSPSSIPTQPPSLSPSQPPSLIPSIIPTFSPSITPSLNPTQLPSITPTKPPSITPSLVPSISPTEPPNLAPSSNPTQPPSLNPTQFPSITHSFVPSISPTQHPSVAPFSTPSNNPTQPPTVIPSNTPTQPPSILPSQPPSRTPTQAPSMVPTFAPNLIPLPTATPIQPPSNGPSVSGMSIPTLQPSYSRTTSALNVSLTPLTSSSPADISDTIEITDVRLNITIVITYGKNDEITPSLIENITIHLIAVAASINSKDIIYTTNIISNTSLLLNISLVSTDLSVDLTVDYVNVSLSNDIENTLKDENNIDTDVDVHVTNVNKDPISSLEAAELSLASINEIFRNFNIIMIIVFIIISVSAFIDAKIIRVNDVYKISKIFSPLLHFLDAISDVFLCIEVYIVFKYTQNELYFILMLCMSFVIVIPVAFSIFQLNHYSKKYWMQSDEIKIWIRKNVYMLYIASILTGSSFSAISMFNSNIFNLSVFDMGLPPTTIVHFQTKRIFSIVICENIPQLILQFIYKQSTEGTNSIIVIASMIYSSISILITLIAIFTQRRIIYNQSLILIEFDVCHNEIAQNAYSLRNITAKLNEQISVVLGISKNLIDVIRPVVIKNGLRISLMVNVDIDKYVDAFQDIMIEIKDDGTLSSAIQNAWKLNNKPNINNVKISVKESKKTIDETVHIQMENIINKNDIDGNNAMEYAGKQKENDNDNVIKNQNDKYIPNNNGNNNINVAHIPIPDVILSVTTKGYEESYSSQNKTNKTAVDSPIVPPGEGNQPEGNKS